MKKIIQLIYLIFTAFLLACTNTNNRIDKEQINRATAINTEITLNGEKVEAEELGFNTDLEKAQEKTKDEEKHLNAKLHTDLLNKDEIDKLKEAGKKLANVAEALTSSGKTLGNLSERYTQSTLADGMADVILDNTDRLSILEKEAMKDGKINDEVVNEKAGAMLAMLEDTLTKFGYKGKEIRFAITDVIDPNGNTFTSTKEHITVLDRKFLATATKEDLLERVTHEFGHYTKEDNEMKSQKVAKYFSSLVMEKVKGVSSKTATEETYARIRNNKNVITGKEGSEIAKNIPMDDREYKAWGVSHNSMISAGISINGGGSLIFSLNDLTKEIEISQTVDFGAGAGTPSIGNSINFTYYPYINSSKDIDGASLGFGGSINLKKINLGVELGVDLLEKRLDSYSFGKGIDSSSFADRYGANFKKFDKLEGHIAINASKVVKSFKVSSKEVEKILNLESEMNKIEEKIKSKNINQYEILKLNKEKIKLKIEQSFEVKQLLEDMIEKKSLFFSNPLLYHHNETEHYQGD